MQNLATQKKDLTLDSIKDLIFKSVGNGSSWISSCKISFDKSYLYITAENQFSCDVIKGSYFDVLNSVAKQFSLSLKIDTSKDITTELTVANDLRNNNYIPEKIESKKTSSFDDFVISDQNLFAVSACKKIADLSASFSLLFLYGQTGCGKSLLAKCINSSSKGKTVFMSASNFVSEFARSISEHSTFAFKDFCRNLDTFILDDVHILSGKRASTEEFLQLIIDLHTSGKNVVLTSSVSPSNLSGFDHKALSLFSSGLVIDIASPDKNTKKSILLKNGIEDSVAEFISNNIENNGHLISGVLTKLKTYSEIMGEKITIKVAERLLSDFLGNIKTPVSIAKEICKKLSVSFENICSNSRNSRLVHARQIIMSILKEKTDLSLAEIGKLLGNRTHATVLYAISQIEKLKSSDLIIGSEIEQIIKECC